MKCHRVVGVFWLVLRASVGRFSEPTAGYVLVWDLWPWEGQPSWLAAWEARISLVLTTACGIGHFLTVCDFRFRTVFWIPRETSYVTVDLLKR